MKIMRILIAFILSITMVVAIAPADMFAFAADDTVAKTALIATGFAKSGKQVVKWTKVSGADGYEVYFAEYGSDFKIVKTVNDNNTFSYTKKGLSNNKVYMFKVKAYNEILGDKTYISVSPDIYVVGISCKYSNATAVEMELLCDGDLKIGETEPVFAKILSKSTKKMVFANDRVAKIRYYSADENIVKIDSFGKLNTVGEGRCYIYAVAPSGAYSKIEIGVFVPKDIRDYGFDVPGNQITYQPVWDDDDDGDGDNLSISDIKELTYDRSKTPEDFNGEVNPNCGVRLSSTDLGKSEITITGYGEYEGEVVIPVTIVKNVFDAKKEPLTLSFENEFCFISDDHPYTLTYTGNPIEPENLNVYLEGEYSYITIQKEDYDIQYKYSEDTVNIGEKQIIAVVTFKNRMVGTAAVTQQYNIGPENTKITSLKAGKKSLTIEWKKKTSNVDGYIIVLSGWNTVKHKKYYVNSNKTTKKVIKNLKAKSGYDVFVMTYKNVDGKKIPSSYIYAEKHGKSIKTK